MNEKIENIVDIINQLNDEEQKVLFNAIKKFKNFKELDDEPLTHKEYSGGTVLFKGEY